MDVQLHTGTDTPTDQESPHRSGAASPWRRWQRDRSDDDTTWWIGEILGTWKAQEIRIARGFSECRGLNSEQLEDIYQETVLALLKRPYHNEEHLRNALRTGIKHRALRLHRDDRRHHQILTRHASSLRLMAQASEEQRAPEPVALAHEDRLIAAEFMTELDDQEKRVFAWMAEGLQYRAIASVLEIPVNKARNTTRSCARKRERFQLLYDTGRLCGYRARTIQAMQNGEATSEELAERAFAHLESCAHCRAEHKTNAKRLRASFRDQATALLPPVLIGRLGWLTRLTLRTRTLQQNLMPNSMPLGPDGGGGVRERAVALIAGSGAAAKVAAGVATVALLAGGTIGATHVLEHHSTAKHRHTTASSIQSAPPSAIQASLLTPSLIPARTTSRPPAPHAYSTPHRSVAGRASPSGLHPYTSRNTAGQRREPGGFAYLGVPAATPPSTRTEPAPVHTVPAPALSGHHTGGLFSP